MLCAWVVEADGRKLMGFSRLWEGNYRTSFIKRHSNHEIKYFSGGQTETLPLTCAHWLWATPWLEEHAKHLSLPLWNYRKILAAHLLLERSEHSWFKDGNLSHSLSPAPPLLLSQLDTIPQGTSMDLDSLLSPPFFGLPYPHFVQVVASQSVCVGHSLQAHAGGIMTLVLNLDLNSTIFIENFNIVCVIQSQDQVPFKSNHSLILKKLILKKWRVSKKWCLSQFMDHVWPNGVMKPTIFICKYNKQELPF